jgi:HSP90 family molecular chaperone
MKIETQDSAAVVHQVREEGGFTIESNANAFSILFDKLYSNKNQAVVREIYCNAVDVTTNKVPHITVPTEMNPVFVVRDYGPGLSHEDVMALYTTVFRSTKAGDNSKIGGFGLGSKAPFCYTDGFIVNSVHEEHGSRILRAYSMYRGEGTSMPKVVWKCPCL